MRIPAEWATHQALWTAWPSHSDLWLENLAPAQAEVMAMAKALSKGERVKMLVMGEKMVAAAQKAVGDANIEIVPAQFGDIWLRDTAPLFTQDQGKLQAHLFRFNGWGGKYELPHDPEVSTFVADKAKAVTHFHDFVLEGGSVDFDGEGLVLTTKECLLNPNRNPSLSQKQIEKIITDAFDIKRIIWLDRGLLNDHTDGHIDNLARFVAPHKAVCPVALSKDDPNHEVFAENKAALLDQSIEVIEVPSPGLIEDEEGEAVAASHMNFIIGNSTVVVPSYEEVYSKEAVKVLTTLFPTRKVIALPARHVLTGGGSFHCITQQEPA